MNLFEYAAFVLTVREMVAENEPVPRVPLQRAPAELVAAWSDQGFSPVECGRLLVAAAS